MKSHQNEEKKASESWELLKEKFIKDFMWGVIGHDISMIPHTLEKPEDLFTNYEKKFQEKSYKEYRALSTNERNIVNTMLLPLMQLFQISKGWHGIEYNKQEKTLMAMLVVMQRKIMRDTTIKDKTLAKKFREFFKEMRINLPKDLEEGQPLTIEYANNVYKAYGKDKKYTVDVEKVDIEKDFAQESWESTQEDIENLNRPEINLNTLMETMQNSNIDYDQKKDDLLNLLSAQEENNPLHDLEHIKELARSLVFVSSPKQQNIENNQDESLISIKEEEKAEITEDSLRNMAQFLSIINQQSGKIGDKQEWSKAVNDIFKAVKRSILGKEGIDENDAEAKKNNKLYCLAELLRVYVLCRRLDQVSSEKKTFFSKVKSTLSHVKQLQKDTKFLEDFLFGKPIKKNIKEAMDTVMVTIGDIKSDDNRDKDLDDLYKVIKGQELGGKIKISEDQERKIKTSEDQERKIKITSEDREEAKQDLEKWMNDRRNNL